MKVRGLVLLLTVLNSCATPSTDENILERSKSDTPGWLKLPLNQFVKNDKRMQIYSFTDNEPDLPLGLKKAQTSALEIASKALTQKVEQDSKVNISAQKKAELTKNIFQKFLKIDDIYYEKMRSKTVTVTQTDSVYRISTLLGIDIKDYEAELTK